jgi:glycosyltransferase involved in cell wall biosynthesis
MRILLVADFYPPSPGGLEAHVRRLGQALVRAGHDVAVLAGGATGGPDDDAVDAGVRVRRAHCAVERIPFAYRQPGRAFHPPWPDRVFGRALREMVEEFEPDVVHAHGWCEFTAAATDDGRRPVVVTLHDHGLRCPKKNLLRGRTECGYGRGLRCLTCPGSEQGPLTRAVLSGALAATAPRLRVARYIAVSQHVARRHQEAYPDDRIEVIPNFLDPPPEPFTEPTGAEVLFVGPADRHKGLPVLLAARSELPAAARIVVVGVAGTDEEGREKGGREEDGRQEGGREEDGRGYAGLEFAGRLTGEPLWQRFRRAAVVVVPSVWPDPCPTVVLEALAHGRPVVGSRAGGIPDLVSDGVTGLLVPPGDPRALAAAVAALLGDRDRLVTMARAARLSARRFATDTVVARIVDVYQDVTVRRGAR